MARRFGSAMISKTDSTLLIYASEHMLVKVYSGRGQASVARTAAGGAYVPTLFVGMYAPFGIAGGDPRHDLHGVGLYSSLAARRGPDERLRLFCWEHGRSRRPVKDAGLRYTLTVATLPLKCR
jgi:hypothetical protein